MEKLSALVVVRESTSDKGPVNMKFNVEFIVDLKKLLNKQSSYR